MVGLGAVACVACCAGPILAFLGGLTVAGLVGTILFGVAGLAVVAVVGANWSAIRRHRRDGSPTTDQPVSVAAPAAKGSR